MTSHHLGGKGGYCAHEDDGSSPFLSFLSWTRCYAIVSYMLLFYSCYTIGQKNINFHITNKESVLKEVR